MKKISNIIKVLLVVLCVIHVMSPVSAENSKTNLSDHQSKKLNEIRNEFNNEIVEVETEVHGKSALVIREGNTVYLEKNGAKEIIAIVEIEGIELLDNQLTYTTMSSSWGSSYFTRYNIYPKAMYYTAQVLAGLIGAVIPGMAGFIYGVVEVFAGLILDKLGYPSRLPSVLYISRLQSEWRGCPMYKKYLALLAFSDSARNNIITSSYLDPIVTNFEGVHNSPANPAECRRIGF